MEEGGTTSLPDGLTVVGWPSRPISGGWPMAQIFLERRPLVMNKLYKSIRSPVHRAAEVRWWRERAAELWGELQQPPLPWPVVVIATPHYPTLANRPDVAACHPAVKAAVDGLMDVGLLPDDNPDVVAEYRHLRPVMRSPRGLGLLVEVEPHGLR